MRHLLRAYASYYNATRTHRSLDKDAPVHRPVQLVGGLKSRPILGGLHHQYVRIEFSAHTSDDMTGGVKTTTRLDKEKLMSLTRRGFNTGGLTVGTLALLSTAFNGRSALGQTSRSDSPP